MIAGGRELQFTCSERLGSIGAKGARIDKTLECLVANQHRALTPYLELAAILCHVEPRVIGNDYTFSFAGRRYQIPRAEVQAGMRHQALRVELRLDGELKARYQGRCLTIAECGARPLAVAPAVRKPLRKDHNAGGKSAWMQRFFDRPSPPLWKAVGD